jgi:hypothetical protein
MSYLQIMVINNKSQEPVQYSFTLSLSQSIDFLHVVAESKNALPTGDGVGAHDGMDGFEDFANVFGGAAGLGVDLETIFLGRFIEFRLGVCGC